MNDAELPGKFAVAIGIIFVTAAAIYFAVRIFELALYAQEAREIRDLEGSAMGQRFNGLTISR
jgi:hypothetical protein